MIFRVKRAGLIVLVTVVAVFFVVLVPVLWPGDYSSIERPVTWGVTYSAMYARELGLDWQETYLAVLDDLQVRHLRIPAYWSSIESENDRYDWSEVDWLVAQAEQREASIILGVGMKLPRWPECFLPVWTDGLAQDELEKEILSMLQAVVTRYNARAGVQSWQVENEALFPYGVCPKLGRAFLAREVSLVRSLSDKPVIVTDSGEWSTWFRTGTLADELGVSLYRDARHKLFGYLKYPFTPGYYYLKSKLVGLAVDRVLITELQAEPWVDQPLISVSLDEQREAFSPERLQTNIEFARRTGFDEIYLWGAEWWYWRLQMGDEDYWSLTKNLFQTDALLSR